MNQFGMEAFKSWYFMMTLFPKYLFTDTAVYVTAESGPCLISKYGFLKNYLF